MAFWWFLLGLIIGEAVGLFVFALLSANKSDKD